MIDRGHNEDDLDEDPNLEEESITFSKKRLALGGFVTGIAIASIWGLGPVAWWIAGGFVALLVLFILFLWFIFSLVHGHGGPEVPSISQTIGKLFRPYGRLDAASLDAVGEAFERQVRAGTMMFNPPREMRQGCSERIEIAVERPALAEARSTVQAKPWLADLKGRGELVLQPIDTSSVMRVEVSGSAFQITPLSPAEQLVVRAARWEFDVLPLRSGKRVLQFRVSMIIELRGQSNQYVAVPVLERGILVHVNLAFAGKRIFSANWQWVCATLLGLGGTLAAWITLFGGHKGT